MQIEIKKSLLKDLDKIPNSVKNRLKIIVEELHKVDNLQKIKQIKKLKNYKTYYRLKLGDYRLGFVYENNQVILVRFLHRKDIYKLFP